MKTTSLLTALEQVQATRKTIEFDYDGTTLVKVSVNINSNMIVFADPEQVNHVMFEKGYYQPLDKCLNYLNSFVKENTK
jgi:pantothenate kinase